MKSLMLALSVSFLTPIIALHAAAPVKSSKPNFIVVLSDDQSWVGTSQRMIPGNPETASDYQSLPKFVWQFDESRFRRHPRGMSIKPTAKAGPPSIGSS